MAELLSTPKTLPCRTLYPHYRCTPFHRLSCIHRTDVHGTLLAELLKHTSWLYTAVVSQRVIEVSVRNPVLSIARWPHVSDLEARDLQVSVQRRYAAYGV